MVADQDAPQQLSRIHDVDGTYYCVALDPALFDPKTIEHVYGTPAIKQDDGTYLFSQMDFSPRNSIFF